MGRRIVLIGPDKPVYNERIATEAITPGMFVNTVAAGTVEKNDLVSATDQPPHKEIAVENDIYGGGIDDDYATGSCVLSQVLQPGCEVNALVAAGADAIAYDAYVTFAAGGFVAVGTVATAIGMAREAVDNSGGGTAARIRIIII